MKIRKQYIGKPRIVETLKDIERNVSALERAGLTISTKVVRINAPARKSPVPLVPHTAVAAVVIPASPIATGSSLAIHNNRIYISLLSRDSEGASLDPFVGTILIFNLNGDREDKWHYDFVENEVSDLGASPTYLWLIANGPTGIYTYEGELVSSFEGDLDYAEPEPKVTPPFAVSRIEDKLIAVGTYHIDETVPISAFNLHTVDKDRNILASEYVLDYHNSQTVFTGTATGGGTHSISLPLTISERDYLRGDVGSIDYFMLVKIGSQNRGVSSISSDGVNGTINISLSSDPFSPLPSNGDTVELIYLILKSLTYPIIPRGDGKVVLYGRVGSDQYPNLIFYGMPTNDYFELLDSSLNHESYWVPNTGIYWPACAASFDSTIYITESSPSIGQGKRIFKYVGSSFDTSWLLPDGKRALAMDCDDEGNLYVLTLPEDGDTIMTEGSWVLVYNSTGVLANQWRVRGPLEF